MYISKTFQCCTFKHFINVSLAGRVLNKKNKILFCINFFIAHFLLFEKTFKFSTLNREKKHKESHRKTYFHLNF